MRLALASGRQPGPLQPRNGNRTWLVTCIVTVMVAALVVLKVTGSSCPADPYADGGAATAGGASPDSSTRAGRTGAAGTAAGGTGGGGTAAGAGGGGGTAAGGTGASALAASPDLARSAIEGHAVFYDPGRAVGSCGLGPFPAGGRYASLPPRSYASGRACGSYLDVYGPRGTVRAEIVDVCTDCAAGTVNLSRAAFARIADPRTGTVVASYRTALDPPLPGPLVLRIAPAPGPGTLAVQVIDHGNRLLSVEASRAGGRWHRLIPGPDGYWTGPLGGVRPGPGAVPGGATPSATPSATATAAAGVAGNRIRVRITDIAGHQVVLTGITAHSAVLHATAWMYRARDRAAGRGRLPHASAAPRARREVTARPGSC